MAQRLSALAALPEDLGSNPSTHMAAQKTPSYRHTHGQNSNAHNMKISKVLERKYFLKRCEGQGDGSIAKNVCCSCRRLEFSSQHPCQVAHGPL